MIEVGLPMLGWSLMSTRWETKAGRWSAEARAWVVLQEHGGPGESYPENKVSKEKRAHGPSRRRWTQSLWSLRSLS